MENKKIICGMLDYNGFREQSEMSSYIDTLATDAEVASATAKLVKSAEYSSDSKKIYFTSEDGTVTEMDATPFIKDAMIQEVKISEGEDGKKNLKITWNTDGDDKVTEIPLADIFDPNQYYTSAQTDTLLNGKTDASAFTAHTADTEVHVTATEKAAWNAKAETSDIPTKVSQLTNDSKYALSADVQTEIKNLVGSNNDAAEANTVWGAKAYTDSKLSDYLTKTEAQSNYQSKGEYLTQTDYTTLKGLIDELSGKTVTNG